MCWSKAVVPRQRPLQTFEIELPDGGLKLEQACNLTVPEVCLPISHQPPQDLALEQSREAAGGEPLQPGSATPQHITETIAQAVTTWLKNEDIWDILVNWQSYGLQTALDAPNHPSGGNLYLFDRNTVRYFRKDNHAWRKKTDGRSVRETHEKLKVNGALALNCYYAHSIDNTLQRRSYWLLEGDACMVLVHYAACASTRRSMIMAGITAAAAARNSSKDTRPRKAAAAAAAAGKALGVAPASAAGKRRGHGPGRNTGCSSDTVFSESGSEDGDVHGSEQEDIRFSDGMPDASGHGHAKQHGSLVKVVLLKSALVAAAAAVAGGSGSKHRTAKRVHMLSPADGHAASGTGTEAVAGGIHHGSLLASMQLPFLKIEAGAAQQHQPAAAHTMPGSLMHTMQQAVQYKAAHKGAQGSGACMQMLEGVLAGAHDADCASLGGNGSGCDRSGGGAAAAGIATGCGCGSSSSFIPEAIASPLPTNGANTSTCPASKAEGMDRLQPGSAAAAMSGSQGAMQMLMAYAAGAQQQAVPAAQQHQQASAGQQQHQQQGVSGNTGSGYNPAAASLQLQQQQLAAYNAASAEAAAASSNMAMYQQQMQSLHAQLQYQQQVMMQTQAQAHAAAFAASTSMHMQAAAAQRAVQMSALQAHAAAAQQAQMLTAQLQAVQAAHALQVAQAHAAALRAQQVQQAQAHSATAASPLPMQMQIEQMQAAMRMHAAGLCSQQPQQHVNMHAQQQQRQQQQRQQQQVQMQAQQMPQAAAGSDQSYTMQSLLQSLGLNSTWVEPLRQPALQMQMHGQRQEQQASACAAAATRPPAPAPAPGSVADFAAPTALAVKAEVCTERVQSMEQALAPDMLDLDLLELSDADFGSIELPGPMLVPSANTKPIVVAKAEPGPATLQHVSGGSDSGMHACGMASAAAAAAAARASMDGGRSSSGGSDSGSGGESPAPAAAAGAAYPFATTVHAVKAGLYTHQQQQQGVSQASAGQCMLGRTSSDEVRDEMAAAFAFFEEFEPELPIDWYGPSA